MSEAARRGLPLPARYAVLQLLLLIVGWRLFSGAQGCGRGYLPSWVAFKTTFPDKGSVVQADGARRAARYSQAAGLQIEERCRSKHAEELARRFVDCSAATANFTACPSRAWLQKLRDTSPGGSRTLVHVGGQSEYTSAAWFSLWAPQLGLTPAAVQTLFAEIACGPCNECAEQVPPAANSGPAAEVQVLSVEPEPQSYSRLVKLRDHTLSQNTTAAVQWRLVQAAVGSSRRDGNVAVCSSAGGGCRVLSPAEAGNDAAADLVAVVALDDVLALHKLQHVDLLKVDANGDELAALGGALGSLAAGRIDVLEFAYSGQGQWQQAGRLGDAVSRLDELGYSCYLQGKQTPDGSLARLTGCWHASYETLTAASVLCVLRSHALYPHTERLSLRHTLYNKVYYWQHDSTTADAAHQNSAGNNQTAAAATEAVAAAGTPNAAAVPQQDKVQPGKHGAAAQAESSAGGKPAGPSLPVTSDLKKWAAAPDNFIFQEPQSGCLLHPDGSAEPRPGWQQEEGMPFLFDTASMPKRDTSCSFCPKNMTPPFLCCGVCIFEDRLCSDLYPGQRKSEAAAQLLMDSGYQLRAFTPCELFQRIRGRTLWFMGDSQTWHFYYSAECFLRNFAPSLIRSYPIPRNVSAKLVTVTWPVPVAPICLVLALGTRVCALRVDSAEVFRVTVLPTLHRWTPNFNKDLAIFNEGLHYGTPGVDGKPPQTSQLYRDLAALVAFKQRNQKVLPKIIWADASMQHFSGPDGSYPGRNADNKYACSPLHAWYNGDPVVKGGGRRNSPLAPLIPQFADAHLRTWNASVPFWDTHKPGECTHWCSPSAYHTFLYLLNDLLRDAKLGNPAKVAPRPSMHASQAVHERAAAAALSRSGNNTQ